MSRLIQLLNEKGSVAPVATETTSDTNFKVFTPAGNLFRLMLVVNADHPVVFEGPQNMVAKMFDSMVEENPKGIKSLQASFNKIKKTLAANKKVTVSNKKEYFELLFPLLMPMTGLDIKQSTLSTNFAGNTPSHLAGQRRTVVLIGKGLLANKDVELNSKDRMMIKGYINGFDAVDGIEADKQDSRENIEDHRTIHNATEVEEQSPPTAATKVVKGKKAEELKNIKQQSTAVKKGIKGLTKDNTAELRQLMDENESPEPFKVSLTGSDTPVNDVINSKMAVFYNQTKLEFGPEIANFSTKLFSNALKHLNDANGYLNFIKGEVDMTAVKTEDGGLRVSMKTGKSASSEHQFFMVKTFRTDSEGLRVADHEKIQIPLGAQSTGINKKIFKDALELYKAEDIDKITLQANVDVGGYAWFRYGFVPKDNNEIEKIANWMEQVGGLIFKALKYDAAHIAKFIDDKSTNKTKGINNLVNLLGKGQTVQADIVIKQLLKECAAEFKSKYTDKSSYKELGRNIAMANFKDHRISGNVYTISYKALLSIQSLNVNGVKPIPMVSGVYLDWAGELDMKNLDDTNAYVNMKKG
jgi:hypothetical protein